MKYSNITGENYDFLWKVGGVSYLFQSIWLHQQFLARDFLLSHNKDTFTFYISKKEREKLSKEGLKLFLENFDTYKSEVVSELPKTEDYFNELAHKEYVGLDAPSLAKEYRTIINKVQRLWERYFWSEYFCYDEISRIITENDLNYNVGLLKENAQTMGELKLKERFFLNQTFYSPSVLDPLYNAISVALGITKLGLNSYHYEEVLNMLESGQLISIPDRSVLVKGQFSNWKDIRGDEALNLMKQLERFDASQKILKGAIGNKGFYRGKVRKIEFSLDTNYSEEIERMEKGEVLVSGSTGPELILACQKAGAIVTDEGGITSHAAIVSRELKIPSVIGTKYATRLLNDGDMVEVDADNGIVRIIN